MNISTYKVETTPPFKAHVNNKLQEWRWYNMAQSSAQSRSEAGAKAWFGNAMKSVGRSTVETFKKIAPNTSNLGAGMYQGGRKVRSSLSPTNLIGISRDLTRNKYVKIAKNALNQSLRDIKSGNLYNGDRAASAYLGSNGMDDFDFSGFGDDDLGGEGGDNFFINDSSSSDNAATFAMTGAIAKNSETTVAVGNAMVDTMTGLSSAVISELQSGFGEMSSKMESINSTLNAMLEFQNQNTTKFYESVLSSINKMAPPEKEVSYVSDNNPMAVFGSKGGVNFSSYKDYIKKQMKHVVEQSPAGMVMGMLDDSTLEMLFADPVGGLTNTIVTAMVPNVVERTLKTVDKTLGDLEQNALLDLGKWAKDPSKNFIQQMIGSIFGVTPDEVKRGTNMAGINKDAAVFDNITRNTLVEVLPKYARESTAYLKEIAMHVTKRDEKALLSKSDVFDASRNRYVKQDQLMQEFMKDMVDNITDTFKSTEFGQAMNSISGNLSGKDKDSFDKAFNQFIAKMATSDHNFTYRDFNVDDKASPIYKLLKNTGTKQDRALLREAIKYMYDNGQAGGAARAQQDTRTAWNNQVNDLTENFDIYNLHALGIDNNTDLVNMLLQYQQDTEARGSKKKTSGRKRVKNALGKRQRASELVSESITGWEAGEDMFNSDRKLSGGQIANKVFGAEFGQGFKEMGGHTVSAMQQIMRGNTQGAMAEFGKIFTSQMKNMWEGAKTHFIKPLSEKLYGKDADGNAIGIFAGARNKLNDTYKSILQKVNGKDYEDSKGNLHKAEEGTSLVDKAAEVFKTVKGGVVSVLFGDKVKVDENGNPIEGAKKGIFSVITDTMKSGVQGWKEAIFGESDDPEKEIEDIKKKALKHLPSAIGGGAGGAFIGALSSGSLFGTLIGGPVGGAALGFASSFLFKSEKFKDYLFGPEIEDGDGNKRRIGGLISEKTQKIFKDNKNSIIGGAALGALKSIVFPNSVGLMANIVGGPIAGAAIGAGVGLLKKSDAFQKFLYGDEENGKEGVVTAFKKMFKKDGNTDPNMDKENAKAIGMGITGAGAGMLSSALIGKMGILGAMATPAGPLGGAIVGAAVGIASGSKKFREFLFGKKDPETGDKKGGLFQKFGNFLHVEVLSPMKDKAQSLIDDAMITFKYDVLETIRLPFTIMAGKIAKSIGNARGFISEKVGNAIQFVYKETIRPVVTAVYKVVFAPAKKILSKATDIMYNFAKMTITAPFRLVRHIGRIVTSPIRKGLHKIYGMVKHGVAWTFKKVGKLLGGIYNVATAPFRFVGKKVKDTFTDMKDRAAEKYKEGGGIRGGLYRLGAKLTSSEWRRGDYENQAEKLEKKKEAKANARKRSIADYNRRLVARELGYDVKYFTEQTMNDAIEHARSNGKKLKFRGAGIGQDISNYFDVDPAEKRKELLAKSTAEIARTGDRSEDVDIRQLTEQHRTNEILEEMRDILGGDVTSSDNSRINEQLVREAREHGFDYNPETGEFNYIEEEDEEAPPKKRRSFKDWINDNAQAVENAGGIGKFFANGIRSEIGSIKSNIRDGYNGSWLQSVLTRRSDTQLDDVVDEASRSGHARAAGGPINEGEPYIVGEGGRDISGAELIVPNQNSTVFSQGRDGIHVYVKDFDTVSLSRLHDVISSEDKDQESILTQTLSIIEDLAEDIPIIGKSLSKVVGIANERLRSSQFNMDVSENGLLGAVSDRLPFGGHRATGGAVARNHVYLVGDGGTDPQAKELFVPQTSGKILAQGNNGIKVVITGFTQSAKNDLSNVEFEGAESQTGTALSVVQRANSYAVMKEKAEALKEQEADNARDEKMLATMEDIRDKNVTHHNIWNSIFSKKGIVTMGLIAAGLMLMKHIPKIVDFLKNLKPIFDNIGEVLKWFQDKGAGDGGQGTGELLEDKLGQLGDSASDAIHGNFGSAASKFILDNGKWDANSGGRVALLANLARKPLRTAIKVGSKIFRGAKWVGGKLAKGAKWVGGKAKTGFGKVAGIFKNKFGKNAGEAGLSVIDNATGEVVERLTGDVVTSSVDDVAQASGHAMLGQADDAARLALPGVLDDGTRIAASQADDAAKFAVANADDVAKMGARTAVGYTDDVARLGSNIAASTGDDFIEGTVRTFRGGAARTAAGVADDGAAALAKSSKGLVGKVVGIIDDFIKMVLKKVGAKMPGPLKTIVKKVTTCVANKFSKIAAKITAIVGGKGTAEAATLGLSTAVFCTIGAINGATGAARLFKVDKSEVDPTMVLISTAMGALVIGTTIGSIIDVVAGLVYEILGFDFLGTVALCIYQFIIGEDGAANVMKAQEEWRSKFETYQSGAIESELATQKAAGLVSQDLTVDQFKEGLKTGEYSASVQGFQDWNADQNQTLGYKAGKLASKGWKGVKKFFGGSTKYIDENTGQQYVDNGDGTYTVIGSDGKKIGNVAKGAVDTAEMTQDHKKGLNDHVKDGWNKVKDTAGVIGDGAKNLFTTVKNGAHDVIDYGVDFVKGVATGGSNIVKNFANPDVDILGYFKANVNEVKEDNPLHGIADALLNISKFTMLPKLVIGQTVTNVGKAVVGGIKDIASGIVKFVGNTKEAIGGYNTGMDQIKANFNNPNMDVAAYFQSEINPVSTSNPFHGFVGSVLSTQKFAQFPILLVSGLLKKAGTIIGTKIREFAAGASRVVNAYGTETQKIRDISSAGDLDGLNSYTPSVDENVPIGGIVSGILTANKFVAYIPASVMWAGKKVASGLKKMATSSAKVINTFHTNNEKLTSLADAGDIDGLNNFEATVEEGTPLSGFVAGISTATKITKYPSAMVHWAGNKVASGLKAVTGKVSSISDKIKEHVKIANDFADKGDVSGLLKWDPKFATDTPITGVALAAATGAKYMHVPGTAIKWVGNKIGDAISSAAKGIQLGKDIVSDYGARLMSYSDTGKDMAGFDNEKMVGNDDNFVTKLMSGVIRFVVKPIVQFKRALSSIGDWIKEKVGDVGDWIMGLFNKGKEVANGKYDEQLGIDNTSTGTTTATGGNGMGSKKHRTFGGKGPDSLNGAAYFSQEDPQWAQVPYIQKNTDYDDATISDTGCGPVSMAMIAKQMGRGGVNPIEMANLAVEGGYRDQTGTNEQYIDYAASKLGLGHTDVYSPSADYITTEAAQGRPMILNGMSSGEAGSPYTDAGHYVVAVGADESGNVLINDPRGPQYSTAYNAEYVASQTRKAWSFGGEMMVGMYGGNGVRFGGFGATALSDTGGNNQQTKLSTNAMSNLGKTIGNVAMIGSEAIKQGRNQTGQPIDPNKIDYARKVPDKTVHPDGTVGDWIEIVRKVKALVAAQQPTYYAQNPRYIKINYDGHVYTVRPDCSGIIACMLWIYKVLPEGTNVTSVSLRRPGALPVGFNMISWPGWEGLREGDIIARAGHAEIFANNENGHKVYNGGSTPALCSAGPTTSSGGSYSVVWRPILPGNGGIYSDKTNNYDAVVNGTTSSVSSGSQSLYGNNATTGSTNDSTYSSSSFSNSTGNTGEAPQEGEKLSFTDKLAKVGSIFTKLGSKALSGILLNDWDFDFSDKKATSGDSSASTGSSSYSSSSSNSSAIGGSANVDYGDVKNEEIAGPDNVTVKLANTVSQTATALQGATDKEKIYNRLRSTGYNPFATASIMGCWDVESGNKASRVEGDYIKNYWGHEKVLNNNQTMNAYTDEFLFPAYQRSNVSINRKGYKSGGNYYPGVGLAQWTGPRGEKLFNYAKSNNMNWGGLDTQLSYFDSEMSSNYKGVRDELSTVKNVEDGTRVMLDGYEMSKGYSKKAPKAYQKRLNAAKSIYQQFGGRGQSNKAKDIPSKYPTVDTTTGRLGGTQMTSGDGTTVYNVTQNMVDLSYIERMMKTMVKLLETIGDNTEPVKKFTTDHTRTVNTINETLTDKIVPNIEIVGKAMKVSMGSTGTSGGNTLGGTAGGSSGSGTTGNTKNAELAGQIAKG